MSYKITTTSDFSRDAKRLSKIYRSFKTDFKHLIETLQVDPFQGTELFPGVRKIRMQIKSKGKGKSGGARIITYNVIVNETEGEVFLVMLYDKEDFSSVDNKILKDLIHEMGLDKKIP